MNIKPAYTFLAKLRRQEEVPGIVTVSLDLIRDEDVIELNGGEEFVTVQLVVDPFSKGD